MRRFIPSAARQVRGLCSPGLDFLLNPTAEHRALRDVVSSFAGSSLTSVARSADIDGHFDVDQFREFARLGMMGVTIPIEEGGAGLDALASVIVHHELSKVDPGFCLAYLAHALLFVNNFFYAANAAQRAKYLPKVISGEWIAGMGMSEPSAGTDVLAMKTTAKKQSDGSYLINGGKTWITNGTVGDVFLIYAKVDGKITAFVVEASWKGFSRGGKIDKCGMRASHMCPLFFEDIVVPAENMLGEEGQGVIHMMRNLEIERLGLAAMGVGIADACVDIMARYAKERTAFGNKLTKFGQIQRYIAESFAETEAAKCLTYAVSRNVSSEQKNRIGSDAAKLFSAPVAKRVADNAMQVLGGMGYSRDMPVERLWRDAKLLEIGGGTLEAHHKNIIKEIQSM